MLTEALELAATDGTLFSEEQCARMRSIMVKEILAAGTDARLGHFGGVLEEAEPHVVEINGVPCIADRAAALRMAAKEMGFTLFEPTIVQDRPGEGPAGGHSWQVWYSYGDEGQMLCKAPTQEEAESELEQALEGMAGTAVFPAYAWAQAQKEIAAAAEPKRERAKPVRGHIVNATIAATWRAAGVYTWKVDTLPTGKAVSAKHIVPEIHEPNGVQWASGRGKTPSAQVRLVNIEGRWLGNVHDLIAAARKGLYIPELAAFPDVAANQYVVGREFMRYMRAKGWRPLWWQEEPTGGLRLHGQVWMRDRPIAY